MRADDKRNERRPGRRERGTTLTESMVAVAIVSLLTGLAIPSFQHVMQSNRVAGAANQLIASALADAYAAAGFSEGYWMHGHFDGNANFSASDYGLLWNGGARKFQGTTFLAVGSSATYKMTGSQLQTMYDKLGLTPQEKLDGLRVFQNRYPDGVRGTQL